ANSSSQFACPYDRSSARNTVSGAVPVWSGALAKRSDTTTAFLKSRPEPAGGISLADRPGEPNETRAGHVLVSPYERSGIRLYLGPGTIRNRGPRPAAMARINGVATGERTMTTART